MVLIVLAGIRTVVWYGLLSIASCFIRSHKAGRRWCSSRQLFDCSLAKLNAGVQACLGMDDPMEATLAQDNDVMHAIVPTKHGVWAHWYSAPPWALRGSDGTCGRRNIMKIDTSGLAHL